MKLDKEAARRGVEEKIAKPLGVSFIQAIWGIHDLINETMAAAAKTHIAEKGGNPKIVTIAAFGGAGPVHAYGLAKKLGAPRLLVPPNAGVGSAMGFFTAPRAFDLLRSHKVSLTDAAFAEIENIFKGLGSGCGKNTEEGSGETNRSISNGRSTCASWDRVRKSMFPCLPETSPNSRKRRFGTSSMMSMRNSMAEPILTPRWSSSISR